MRLSRVLTYGASGVFCVLLVLVVFAPAVWLDSIVGRQTEGRVRLAEANGTLWNGSAMIVLGNVDEKSAPGDVVSGVPLPGRVAWVLSPWLLLGYWDLSLSVEGAAQPIRVTGPMGALRVSQGDLTWSWMSLGNMGFPWNTLQPSAALKVHWDALGEGGGRVHGYVELHDVSCAVTPIRPLGSYRVVVDGEQMGRLAVQVSTLSGPLQLTGKGTWDLDGGLDFEGKARANPDLQMELGSVLELLSGLGLETEV